MMLNPGVGRARFEQPTRPGRCWLWGVVVAVATTSGCHHDSAAAIQLVVGRDSAEQKSLVPESALAQYVELSHQHNELIITLADFDASCERFVPPGPGQASVTVTIVLPPGEKPQPRRYGWDGRAAHGGTPSHPERAYAEPTARIGARGYVFPPGGTVQLTRVELSPHGHVDGLLAFEFPGDAKRAAMSVKGRFHAKICRLDQSD